MRQNARMRLVVAAALFVGWLGFLAYLAATGTHPIIISRPQVTVADANIVAQVEDNGGQPSTRVMVKKVITSSGGIKDQLALGSEIEIVNLNECSSPEQGWRGSGLYILPLTKQLGGKFEITTVPASPGFPVPRPGELPAAAHERIAKLSLRIYPDNSQTKRQLEQILELAP